MRASTLWIGLAVLVCVFGVADALSVGQRSRVQRPPRKLGLSAPEACIDNITSAVEQVLAAGDEIVAAVAQCSNSTVSCIADINSCVSDLTQAAAYVSMAVTACGARGSLCVTNLLKVAHDLADAAAQISDAVEDCVSTNTILQCILNVVDAGSFVEKIVVGIEGCVKDCRSNSTRTV